MSVQTPKTRIYSETLDMSDDANSEAINVRYCTRASIQVTYTGADTTSGMFSIQASNDGDNWVTYAGSTSQVHELADTKMWELTSTSSKYIRVRFTAGINTTGTATLLFEGSYE